jgi:predicted ATPase
VGLSLGRERSIAELLVRHLGSSIRVPTLLLLDNLEHLQGAGTLVSELLDACPSLSVLATSQAALRIYGVWPFQE